MKACVRLATCLGLLVTAQLSLTMLSLAQGGATLTHGAVIGGVTSASAIVFVRTDRSALVQARYAPAPDMQSAQITEPHATGGASDFTAQIPISGLSPNTFYYVEILVDGVVAENSSARFKSFPAPDTDSRVSFAILNDFGSYGGTAQQPPLDDPTNTFRMVDARNPDFVFIGGDFDHRNPKTLSEKRQMFKDLYSTSNPLAKMPDFAPHILRRYAIAHQWDDHDYHDNDSDRTAFSRAEAAQAYREYVPSYPMKDTGAIYQSFQYGMVDFFILDSRYYRDPNHEPASEGKSMLDGEDFGAWGELRWLKQGLKKSTARWKIVFSSGVFNPTVRKSDSWVPFPQERNQILRVISKFGIKNVIVISGDIHAGALDDGTNAQLPNMAVPGPNLRYCFTVPEPFPGKWSHGLYGSPLRIDNDKPCNGFGLVRLSKKSAKLFILDTEGKLQLKMILPFQP
jgi:alkaline phosphatase D